MSTSDMNSPLGEFNGNFEQFRRRHQAATRSVHESDLFQEVSKLASIFCPVGRQTFKAPFTLEIYFEILF